MSVFRKKTSEKKNFKRAVLLSLIFHAFFFAKNIEFPKTNTVVNKKTSPKKVRLVFKNSKRKMQIVNTQENSKKEKPLDSKFLSKSNQKFDRQTVAKSIGKFKAAGFGSKMGQETPKKTKQIKQPTKTKKKLKDKIAKKSSRKRRSKLKKKISLADLSIPKFTDVLPIPKKQIAKGTKTGSKGKLGLASNNDFIEDIPLGDVTNLNTIEFKYYGFYFRIRQKLEQYWGNTLKTKAKKLFKQGRHLASDENHITSLKITLDTRGNIVDILVKGTSGVQELDEAAVESFNRAGPFPNPPKGMMSNGRAHIEWGFVVKS